MTQLHWPPSQGSPTYTKLTHTPITAADTVDTLLWHVHTADKTVLLLRVGGVNKLLERFQSQLRRACERDCMMVTHRLGD